MGIAPLLARKDSTLWPDDILERKHECRTFPVRYVPSAPVLSSEYLRQFTAGLYHVCGGMCFGVSSGCCPPMGYERRS